MRTEGSRRRRLPAWLPEGAGLREAAWIRRHRVVLIVLWLHAAALPMFALARGENPGTALMSAVPLVAVAAVAGALSLPRRLCTSAAALGAVGTSALLVHLATGATEMHLHFFVMLTLVALYRDWFTLALAVTFVAGHHAWLGSVAPERLFNHPAAVADPLLWGGFQLVFLLALCAVCLATWKSYERLLEERRAEGELAERLSAERDVARSANQMSAETLTALTRRLQDPMTTVLAMTDRMYQTLLDVEQRELVSGIAAAGHQVLGLVNDVVDLSRVAAGQMELDCYAVSIHDLVESIATRAAAATAGRQVEVRWEVSDVPDAVISDERRIRQVLARLVSNAVKYTPDGQIRISATGNRADDGHWSIAFTVHDTGVGIPPAELDRMLNSGTEPDLNGSREGRSAGLGLALAGRLARLLGGDIWAQSIPGLGSTFTFTITAPESDRSGELGATPRAHRDSDAA